MLLDQAFDLLPGTIVPEQFDRFRQQIDPEYVERALTVTGTATMRRRRLPADQVLWLVIGMGLMRNESIERVVALLDLALPTTDGQLVARSAIAQARSRLGEEPLEYLFGATGAEWATRSADAHRWRGLALYGMDGTTIRVPDSTENWEAFGGQVGNGSRNGSAYPTVRVVALMALRSHLLSALRFGPYATGELTLAADLWAELPNDSLMIVDRNFLAADVLTTFARTGESRHWLTRAKSKTRLRKVKQLGRNDQLVEIELSAQTRKRYPDLPPTWVARAITYRKQGFPPATLLTSLLDSKKYPASELIAVYHERWEIELGYDEVKTHLLAREETIRSKTPEGVRQELWGIGLAYNLVRLEMERAADEAGVEPRRISFVNALSLIRYAWLISSTPPIAPARTPGRLLDLRRDLKLLLLPERRPKRSFPRAVKIKMSNYDRKAPLRDGPK